MRHATDEDDAPARAGAPSPVSIDTGLTAEEVDRSRARHGRNALTPLPRVSPWRLFLAKFTDPIIQILLVAAGLSIGIAVFKGSGHLVEAAAILLAVGLATGVAFLSEYKSDREFELLNAQRDSMRARVMRDGAATLLPIEDLVVGDVVLLEIGDEVPADGRLLRAIELRVDQSLMTGESEPVLKKAGPVDDDPGFSSPLRVFRGTQIMDGNGVMVVTAVGDATEIGKIARSLGCMDAEEEEPCAGGDAPTGKHRVRDKLRVSKAQTPLQQKLTRLAGTISTVGKAAALLIFVVLAARGLVTGELTGGQGPRGLLTVQALDQLLRYLIIMVVIIVVAVPEGLPMSVTVSLALAMRKMTKANSLVRQLMACETIGSATVICSDKTGTLTKNLMEVQRIFLPGRGWQERREVDLDAGAVTRRGGGGGTEHGGALEHLALNAAANSTAHLGKRARGFGVLGNSTEGALLLWLHERGIDYTGLRRGLEPLHQLHFSSERKRMSSVVRPAGSRQLVLYTKGAAEIILGYCSSVLDAGGATRPLDEGVRAGVAAAIEAASGDAMRVLCFAHRLLPADLPPSADELQRRAGELETDMVLDGLVAIADPVRDDVPQAVEECRRAGIEVKMVTGDNVATARAIGARIGLLDRPDGLVLTSDELGALSDAEVTARLDRIRILARARPLDKLRLVRLLQARGEVVAVTGDGTNDAPALKKADVGLAMGSGTEVAKEASKIVLLDDSFTTIVSAVSWGRTLYENIQRFLQFQLTVNIAALAIAFLGPLLSGRTGLDSPLTAVQLLWVNVIMDTFAAIALCSEPPRPGIMTVSPRRRDENILTPAMVWTMFTTAAFFVVVLLGYLLLVPSPGVQPRPTIFFTTFVFFQLWNLLNCRSLDVRQSALAGLAANRGFLLIGAAIVIVQIALVTVGGTAFNTVPLPLAEWLQIVGVTASVLVFGELGRRVRLRLLARTETVRAPG